MFLDIGIGILSSLGIAHAFSVEVTWMWVLVGIIFAVLPDMDIIPYAIKKFSLSRKITDHRSYTHYPIVYIPLTIFVYMGFGLPYATLFFVCIFFHLIHDTLWLGWGVAWGAPFSTRRYKFFPDKDGKITTQFLLSWDEDEEEEIYKEYHNPHWIRDFYFRPNLVAYVEYSVFLFSLSILFLVFY